MQLKLHKKCINYLGPTNTTTAAFSCADVKICALFTQSDVKTKFVALLLQMPTSNRYELPADTCNDVVKISLLIRK